MKRNLLSGLCYTLLALVGWGVGRVAWPAAVSPSVTRIPAAKRHVITAQAGAGFPQDAPGSPEGESLSPHGEPMSPEAAFIRQTREMALLPPPALRNFFAKAKKDPTLEKFSLPWMLEDAAVWAFCRNPAAGLAQLSATPEAECWSLAGKMLHDVSPKDLPTVLAWLKSVPAGPLKRFSLQHVVPVLERQDFAAALALVSALPPESKAGEMPLFAVNSAPGSVGSVLTITSSNGDEITAPNIYDRGTRPDLLRRLLLGPPGNVYWDGLPWQEAPPGLPNMQEVERKLALFPAEDQVWLKQAVERTKFGQLSKEQTLVALADLPASEKQGAAKRLFENWGESDPVRAAAGLTQLPPEVNPVEIYGAFANQWAGGNVALASQWVHDLPPGPSREAAVKGLVDGLGGDYPTEALTWAGTLTDAAARMESLGRILAGAPVEQHPILLEKLDALSLTTSQKAALRQRLTSTNP